MTEARESAALLPCPNPWCSTHRRGNDGPWVRKYHARYYRVSCSDCPQIGPTGADRDEAIAAWNTRATTDLEAVGEACAKVCDQEASDYRHAQDNARDTGDKLYRMGQKDAAIFLAAAIRNTDFTKGERG